MSTACVEIECVTVSYGQVTGKARDYQYWQPALYRHHTAKDGRLLWKYVNHWGTARRSERLALQDAKELADDEGLEYLANIRQWTPVKPDTQADDIEARGLQFEQDDEDADCEDQEHQ